MGRCMSRKFTIIIPTSNRVLLLERTLSSIERVENFEGLDEVIIVENGASTDSRRVLKRCCIPARLEYMYHPFSNKSRALNYALKKARNEFVVFFDDDIRIGSCTLECYGNAINTRQEHSFYCGPCAIDYEDSIPPEWLREYLPPSAKGWTLGREEQVLERPDALGANWGAFVQDIHSVGGFSEEHGPGTKSRGQETEMQKRLLKAGIKGRYLPDAIVWHYVPGERCSEEWTLKRAREKSMHFGLEYRGEQMTKRLKTYWHTEIKLFVLSLILASIGQMTEPRRKFHLMYRRQCHLGFIDGLKKTPGRGV